VISPVAALRGAALDEHVVEAREVTGGFPDLRVHDDSRVKPHYVVAHVHVAAPPLLFDVPFQLDAQRTVVVGGADAAVDLRTLVHETPALAEGHYLVHRYGLRHESSEPLECVKLRNISKVVPVRDCVLRGEMFLL